MFDEFIALSCDFNAVLSEQGRISALWSRCSTVCVTVDLKPKTPNCCSDEGRIWSINQNKMQDRDVGRAQLRNVDKSEVLATGSN